MKRLYVLLLVTISAQFCAAQFPDFSFEDVEGNVVDLQADYLDQGKIVVIDVFATWCGPCWDYNQTKILEDFYQEYGPDGSDEATVLKMEFDVFTDTDEIFGEGNNTMGDWTEGNSYPIIDVPDPNLLDELGIAFFPTTFVLCPDGSAFSPPGSGAPNIFEPDDRLNWGEIVNGDLPALMYELCGEYTQKNKIFGSIYQDLNDSCEKDDNEATIPNWKIDVSGDLDFTRYTNSQGSYSLFLSPGEYTVEATSQNDVWTICPDEETIVFTGDNEEVTLDFGAQAALSCPVPIVEITAPLLRRCFENTLFVEYCNNGTEILENGQVVVTLDNKFIYESSIPAPSMIDGNTLTYDVGDVDILSCGTIKIKITVDCDNTELGEIHCYSAQIYPVDDCGLPRDDTYSEECQENIGSYDPNDKQAFPPGVGEDDLILQNTEIEYLIRFQNTGSDTAFTVRLVDTLSENLDLSTLRFGGHSHEYIATLRDRELEILFENILLPDSTTNLEGSNGFISFRIQQIPDLANGTKINNFADIYFDFNDPIRTNDANYIVDDMLTNTIGIQALPFDLYPNPADHILNVQMNESGRTFKAFEIMNILGHTVQRGVSQKDAFEIPIESLQKGTYILTITDEEDRSSSHTFVKL